MTLDLNKNLVMFRNEGMHIKFFSLKYIEILELVVALRILKIYGFYWHPSPMNLSP